MLNFRHVPFHTSEREDSDRLLLNGKVLHCSYMVIIPNRAFLIGRNQADECLSGGYAPVALLPHVVATKGKNHLVVSTLPRLWDWVWGFQHCTARRHRR